jgi:hypothetical protein
MIWTTIAPNLTAFGTIGCNANHSNRDRGESRGSRPPTPPDVRVTYPAVRRMGWVVSPHSGEASRARRRSAGAAPWPARGADADATGRGLTWPCSRPPAGPRRVFAAPDIPSGPMAAKGRSATAAGAPGPGRAVGNGLRRRRSTPASPGSAGAVPAHSAAWSDRVGGLGARAPAL